MFPNSQIYFASLEPGGLAGARTRPPTSTTTTNPTTTRPIYYVESASLDVELIHLKNISLGALSDINIQVGCW